MRTLQGQDPQGWYEQSPGPILRPSSYLHLVTTLKLCIGLAEKVMLASGVVALHTECMRYVSPPAWLLSHAQ